MCVKEYCRTFHPKKKYCRADYANALGNISRMILGDMHVIFGFEAG